jgi:hypothetical protein
MPFKILCAGFSKDERAALEADVKPVLSTRPRDENWTVSVVKTGHRLAVTVDGPDDRIRGQNFVTDPRDLRMSLSDLLVRFGFDAPSGSGAPGGFAAPSGVAARPTTVANVGPPRDRVAIPPNRARPIHSAEPDEDWEAPVGGERHDTHRCSTCQKSFVVTYVALPNEAKETVSVACPHCWRVDRLEIGQNAALSKEYRADKVN